MHKWYFENLENPNFTLECSSLALGKFGPSYACTEQNWGNPFFSYSDENSEFAKDFDVTITSKYEIEIYLP